MDLVDVVHNLGLLYADQGKLDEAEAMYERALEGFEKHFGSDYPHFHKLRHASVALRDRAGP